jgi:hypothetical protein
MPAPGPRWSTCTTLTTGNGRSPPSSAILPGPSWSSRTRHQRGSGECNGHVRGTTASQVIFVGEFCLVELGGLEPPTPCLQIGPSCRMWSLTWGCCPGRVRWDRALLDPVVVSLGGQRPRAWPFVRSQAHRSSYRPYPWLSCWVCVGVRAWARRSSLSWPPNEAQRAFLTLARGNKPRRRTPAPDLSGTPLRSAGSSRTGRGASAACPDPGDGPGKAGAGARAPAPLPRIEASP